MEVQIRGIHNCYVPTPAFVEIQGEGQDYNCYAPTPEFREKQGMQGLAIVMTDLKFPVGATFAVHCLVYF